MSPSHENLVSKDPLPQIVSSLPISLRDRLPNSQIQLRDRTLIQLTQRRSLIDREFRYRRPFSQFRTEDSPIPTILATSTVGSLAKLELNPD